MPPIALTAWQVGLGCLPMVVYGLIAERARIGPLDAKAAFGMAYMTLVPMGACYLCWFAAVKRLSAPTATMGTLMVPIIGVLSAAPMVGEVPGPSDLGALVLVMGGVVLALRRR